MPLEIWIFSRAGKYLRQGGLVAIATAPVEQSYGETEMYARQLAADYCQSGLEVTTLVRHGAAY